MSYGSVSPMADFSHVSRLAETVEASPVKVGRYTLTGVVGKGTFVTVFRDCVRTT